MPLSDKYNFNPRTRRADARSLVRFSDGDTLVIKQPVRLVSCDTPEKAGYAGGPQKAQKTLDKCRLRLEDGTYDKLPLELRKYLIKKLTPDAAQRHINAAIEASSAFDAMLERRLNTEDGKRRKIAVLATGEIIDNYGRMLAYISPWFDKDELPPVGDPARNTFNLDMIAEGFAAFFPVYPSLPKLDDMKRAVEAAENAWDKGLGVWKTQGKNLLLGYEYRACIKLGTAENADKGIGEAFKRVCVDLATLTLGDAFSFYKIEPSRRLWIWEKHIEEAKNVLGLQ